VGWSQCRWRGCGEEVGEVAAGEADLQGLPVDGGHVVVPGEQEVVQPVVAVDQGVPPRNVPPPPDPAELESLLTPLVDAGQCAARLHPAALLAAGVRRVSADPGWLDERRHRLAVITLGSVGVPTAFQGEREAAAGSLSLAPLVDLFERGKFDLVALGRVLLSEPWATKRRDERLAEIRPYDRADETVLV
jgi:hypothetical protein